MKRAPAGRRPEPGEQFQRAVSALSRVIVNMLF
jgi:hypothetical protein